ncbi:MAG: isoprenylcysteine carboxylmethyltransferase family protein [Candidatus Syntrophonatronum acetioxidans]|uniref:Isoprenylcysteine carboxylmethyltransferase family protein n=1 Tax=Candidatus Syntrophonatronum acetioxidans TaxID=1795816 RepID=A0A424YGL3_9FIRM|nr:MAG: isoprenylcysteine carboxylmethyltransferase family protein [Candidatus Syntrophonatronum acetioxidans]
MLNLLRPGWDTYLFILITLLWWFEFIIFNKPSAKGEKTSKKGHPSFNLILAAILFSLAVSLTLYFFNQGNLQNSMALYIRHTGIFIYGLGLMIRYWALILLGSYFNRYIDVKEGQELISSGPYKILRHPSYTGLLLLNTGLHFFIGNLPGILFSIIIIFTALQVRIREEESAMEELLGERYKRWNRSRKRLFPWIY